MADYKIFSRFTATSAPLIYGVTPPRLVKNIFNGLRKLVFTARFQPPSPHFPDMYTRIFHFRRIVAGIKERERGKIGEEKEEDQGRIFLAVVLLSFSDN